MTSITSPRIRARGRGDTPEERKLSRAAFKAWDTRRKNESISKRNTSSRKINRNRSRSR